MFLIAIICLRRRDGELTEELKFMKHTNYWTDDPDEAIQFDQETAEYEVKQLRKRSRLRYTIVHANDHVSQLTLL